MSADVAVHVIQFFYVALILSTFLSTQHPLLTQASLYGKLRFYPAQQLDGKAPTAGRDWLFLFPSFLATFLSCPALQIPSSIAFSSYYTLALVLNSFLLYRLYSQAESHSTTTFSLLHLSTNTSQVVFRCLCVCLLFELHLARRLYECLFVHVFSPLSKQHILVTAMGLAFYTAACLSAPLDAAVAMQISTSKAAVKGELRTNTIWLCIRLSIALTLFITASYIQHRCHVLLAQLRKPLSSASVSSAPPRTKQFTATSGLSSPAALSLRYSPPPAHPLFTYVVCPHYSAELCIYLSFLMLNPTFTQGSANLLQIKRPPTCRPRRALCTHSLLITLIAVCVCAV